MTSQIYQKILTIFWRTWVIKENIFQRSPKPLVFDRWRWRMSVVSSLQMPRRWQGWEHHLEERKQSGEKNSSAFFFGAEVKWQLEHFLGNLGRSDQNVVLNLLDFMDEMRVEEHEGWVFHDITSIVRHEMRVPRGLKILSVRIRWERLPWLFVIWV